VPSHVKDVHCELVQLCGGSLENDVVLCACITLVTVLAIARYRVRWLSDEFVP